ncbi:MAG: hemolysin family protein [Sulfurimicrobium sp.]|nr:hemolysin family protein [Sulfurimicrobium sp.]MDP2198017.1 hemolysin family protein [Sulfurimicrobium sp.]
MDIALIFLLILVNGMFAMSEIAIVSSRRSKLHNLADDGSLGAKAALLLHQEPSRFFSTVQVGITSISILSGAIGETALAVPLAGWLSGIPLLAPHAKGMALTITVVSLTYVSVVVGELVPKRLALLAPESIASLISRPMVVLARIAHPLVVLLSVSSTAILGLMGARRKDEPPVSNDEIKVLMEQGAEAGVFHESEQEIVSNVLRLDEQHIASIMTPRHDISVIDLEEGEETMRQRIVDTEYSRLVVCRDGLEHILGVLQTGDLLKKALPGHIINTADIETALHPPLFVPESITTTQLLESFRRARLQFALIVDEYGDVQGLATMTDVLTAIVGELSVPEAPEDRDMVQREDGSWLVDGDISVERLKSCLNLADELPGENEHSYYTLGGFIMHVLGRVPSPSDHFIAAGLRFEVMDMDHKRVDKVLISVMTLPADNARTPT